MDRQVGFCVTFSAILNCDYPFVSCGGNRSIWRGPPPYPTSLATLLHTSSQNHILAVVRDSGQSAAIA